MKRTSIFKSQKRYDHVENFVRDFAQNVKIIIDKIFINPRSLEEKIVTRSLGGRGVNRTPPPPPPPSTFDTIHPIDLKFGTCNKLHLYFQLSEFTWCLIGFHGNNRTSQEAAILEFLVYSKFLAKN